MIGPVIDEKLVAAYVSRELVIKCPSIVVRQRRAVDPEVYEGSGNITMLPDGAFVARFVSIQPMRPTKLFSGFADDVAPGTLIPDEHFFSLEATDMSGTIWTNPSVHPSLEIHQLATHVDVPVVWLHVALPRPAAKQDVLVMWCFNKLDIPTNVRTTQTTTFEGRQGGQKTARDRAEFDAGGMLISA